MKQTVIKVEGMACGGCEKRVQNALNTIDGIKDVKADHNTGLVTVNSDESVSEDVMKETVEDIGFTVKGIQ